MNVFLCKRGFIIIGKKEVAVGKRDFTCSNPGCGKAFSRPLKAVNLCSKDAKSYLACPYCLEEITTTGGSTTVESTLEKDTKEIKAGEVMSKAEKKLAGPAAESHCTHYFGYLSQRSSKEEMPEECIVCEQIVPCMLKAVRS